MLNLKKALALVLAVAMVMSFGVISASAYTDVDDSDSYATAVQVLSGLGIIQGYEEDNTFRPNNTITRAEAATVIVRALGMEESAASMTGTTAFSDVAADHWASGYVNIAYQQGIIDGMGDGTFCPSNPVTYEQMVKMIVCALGYTLKAEKNGGYPSGYLAIASQEGITKGASGTIGGEAKRSTVARLVYNALDVKMMEQWTYTTDGKDEYTIGNKTLLNDYLDVEKFEGIVTKTFVTNAVFDGAFDEDDDDIVIYTFDGETITAGANDSGAELLLGYAVEAYIGENDDDEDVIFAIAPKENKNDAVTINADVMLQDITTKANYDAAKFYYYNNTAKDKLLNIELDPGLKVCFNNDIQSGYSRTDFQDYNTMSAAGILVNGGTATFIDNDNDGVYEYVIVKDYKDELVVDEVEVTEDEITISSKNGATDINIELDDEDIYYEFIKDGAKIDVAEIEEDDVITVVADANDVVSYYYVASNNFDGRVDEILSTGEIIIEDKEYTRSNLYTDSIKSGDEGKFYLNFEGKLAYADASSTAGGDYAILIAEDTDTSFGKTTYTLKLVTAEGKTVKVDLADKVEVITNGTSSGKKANDTTAVQNAIASATFSLIKYKLDPDGDVNKLQFATGASGNNFLSYDGLYTSMDKEYDAEDMSVGKFTFDENTIVFNIDSAKADEDDVEVGTVANYFTDGTDVEFVFGTYDESNDGVAAVVVAIDAKASIDYSEGILLLTRDASEVSIGDNEGYKVTGLRNGETVSYILCDDEVEYDFKAGNENDLVKGAAFYVSTSGDYISTIELVNTLPANKFAFGYKNVNSNDADAVVYGGMIADADAIKSATGKFDVYDYNTGDSYTIAKASKANYYLVDYNGDVSDPSIKKTGFTGAIQKESTKYVTYVAVYEYDGDIIDVVAYRYVK